MSFEKLKLAYVSPLPPEKSGISFYSKELIPYLSEYYDITLVVEQEEVESSISEKFRVIKYNEFLKTFKDFDRILCQFGNSPFHKHMLYMIEEVPCVVVLHDVFLSNLINWAHHTGYYPNILFEEAYYSHGWSALLEMKKDLGNFIMKYPLNARVINNSIGVIVHSKHAFDIIKDFYAQVNEEKFRIIPQIRRVENFTDNNEEVKGFLISSFGYITPLKKPDIIIKGFALSKVSKLPNVRLCFIGESSPPSYSEELLKLAKSLNIKDKVSITGFVDEETYREYLRNSSICIQLRSNSKGETSRAVLDIMASKKPLIVNSHGSFKEIPKDACLMLTEDPSPEDVACAIDKLYEDSKLRSEISERAYKYIREFHAPEKVAKEYFEAIEEFYNNSTLSEFLDKISNSVKEDQNLNRLSRLIKMNFSPIVRKKVIYVDVSTVATNDLGTGIQRVVKAQLKGLIENPPEGFRVEPVRLTDEDKKWTFKYARNFTKKFFDINENGILADTEVDFREGDIYYVPDLFGGGVIEAQKVRLYDELILKGVKIAFLIYDLLPIEFPQYFPPGASEVHAEYIRKVLEVSDLILCISQATADSLKSFAEKEGISRKDLKIEVLHLGADIREVKHREGLSLEDLNIFIEISKKPYFLMVSTVEPRKGHFQTIKAFEILWSKGYELNLVIVGKEGWMVEDLVKYIKKHPELNKKLYWLGYVSDDLLDKLYHHATATIMASEGEGFGLAIFESAFYETPIIARDIPVFREVAKDGAYYFPNSKDPEVLARAIEEWLKLYKEGKHPKPHSIKPMTWKEHVEKLKEILLRGLSDKNG